MKRLAALLLTVCLLALPALTESEFEDRIERCGFLFGKRDGGWRLYNSDGALLLDHVWTDKEMLTLPLLHLNDAEPDLYSLRYGRKTDEVYGVIRADGQLVMEPQLAEPVNLRDGLALVELNGLYGYVDASGKWVIPAHFEYANAFHEGLAAVAVDGKCGYIDTQGQWVIVDDFDRAYNFHCGRAVVVQNELYGLIDRNGNWILPAQLGFIDSFSENLAGAHDPATDLWGYLDLNGAWAISPQFSWPGDFVNGRATISPSNNLLGRIDTHGNYVIPPKYENIWEFGEDRMIGAAPGCSGLFDLDGNPLSDQDYDNMFCSGGVIVAIRNNRASFLDRDGNTVFQSEYADISAFDDRGTAVCQLGDQYGLIDRSGNELVAPQYDSLSSCPAGYIAVQDGRYGILSHTGKVLVPVEYAEIHTSGECLISKFRTWIYTDEAYHLKTGDEEFYFDILNGEPVPALPSA